MNVIEVGDKFNCDCGFSWKRGQSGSHSCGDGLRKQIAELQQELVSVLMEHKLMDSAIGAIADAHATGVDELLVKEINAAVNIETPATDALLNAVRAEGAFKVADYHFVRIDALKDVSRQGYLFHKAAYFDAVNIVNLLRAETDTTSSQYESLAGGK